MSKQATTGNLSVSAVCNSTRLSSFAHRCKNQHVEPSLGQLRVDFMCGQTPKASPDFCIAVVRSLRNSNVFIERAEPGSKQGGDACKRPCVSRVSRSRCFCSTLQNSGFQLVLHVTCLSTLVLSQIRSVFEVAF